MKYRLTVIRITINSKITYNYWSNSINNFDISAIDWFLTIQSGSIVMQLNSDAKSHTEDFIIVTDINLPIVEVT